MRIQSYESLFFSTFVISFTCFQKKMSNLYSYINNKEMKKEVAFLPLNVCCKCVGRGEWESVAAC